MLHRRSKRALDGWRRAGAACALGVCWIGGCASRQTTPTGQPIPVETSSDQPIFDLSSPPATQPAMLAEPMVIEDGEKATLIYTCRNARPETLKDAVGGLINPDGSIQASAALNALVINDRREVVRSVLKILQEVDRPVAQVLVEARVVEVTLDSDLETEVRHILTVPESDNSFFRSSEVNLRTPGATPTDGQGSLLNIRPWSAEGVLLNDFVRLLMTRGKARILSSPNVLVSAGSEASIVTGEDVPIQSTQVVAGSLSTSTQFKRVGIKLRVTLQQITNDAARLEINPEVSTVTGYAAAGQGVSNPIVAIRNVSSTLAMKDGEILTVGGLLRDEQRQIVRGIPWIMDVPGVGLLFQSRRNQTVRTQLIFFLRVHILSEGQSFTTRVHKPGSALDQLEDKAHLKLEEQKDPQGFLLPLDPSRKEAP